MNILIRSARVLDPASSHHGKRVDIHLQRGRIAGIGRSLKVSGARVIEEDDLFVSPGWIDLRANFRDPGMEQKENLLSGAAAARAGGFRTVVLMPSTQPVVDSKPAIEYLLSSSRSLPVRVLPTGALSAGLEGKQLAGMYDMHRAGAVAFTDDKAPVGTELLVRALEYTADFGGLIMTFPHDPGVSPGAMMHEGASSTALGLRGIPALAEELRLHRDLEILRYCGGRMHVSLISTAGSVDLIRKAKRSGLQVTCAVAAHQLFYLDEDLHSFDTNLKVLPPLRGSADRKALIKGLQDGTIDAICSDHSPEDHEHKVLEWDYAGYGISGIQGVFHTALTAAEDKVELETIVNCLSSGPAAILGISANVVEEGHSDDLTVFSPSGTTAFTRESWKSRSLNFPAMGKELKGRVFSW